MEVKVLSVKYHIPEVIINTNDYKAFRKYLSNGFCVFDRSNGYCTLRKKSRILVEVEYEDSKSTVNLKGAITQYYGKATTYKLAERFKTDLESDKIRLEVDSSGYFSIVEK